MVEMIFDNKGGCHDYIHNGKIKLFVNNIYRYTHQCSVNYIDREIKKKKLEQFMK
jgi:hypothetical protein